MTANTVPIFPLNANIGQARTATANTNRDGTGTLSLIFTAGANGSRVKRILVKATVTTTAGMIRLYLHDGSNYRLWLEIPVSAITPSASVAAWVYSSYLTGDQALNLPTGWKIYGAPHNATSFDFIIEGADY